MRAEIGKQRRIYVLSGYIAGVVLLYGEWKGSLPVNFAHLNDFKIHSLPYDSLFFRKKYPLFRIMDPLKHKSSSYSHDHVGNFCPKTYSIT